jgi:ubiquitin-protein ligase
MATAVQALARIKKEYKEVQAAKDAGVSAELVNSDYAHWKGTIAGPQGTPYQGGTFYVDIEIPKNYPFVPPKMRFETKVRPFSLSCAVLLCDVPANSVLCC